MLSYIIQTQNNNFGQYELSTNDLEPNDKTIIMGIQKSNRVSWDEQVQRFEGIIEKKMRCWPNSSRSKRRPVQGKSDTVHAVGLRL